MRYHLLAAFSLALMLCGCCLKYQATSRITTPTSTCTTKATDALSMEIRSAQEMHRARSDKDLALIKNDNAITISNQPDLDVGRKLINSGTSIARGQEDSYSKLAYVIAVEFNFNYDQFSQSVDQANKPGSSVAEKVLDSPTISSIRKEFKTPQSSSPKDLSISVNDWINLSNDVSTSTSMFGWTSLFTEKLGQFAKKVVAAQEGKKPFQAAEISTLDGSDELKEDYLIATYMEAYFRNGQVLSLDFNDQDIKSKVADELKRHEKNQTVIDATLNGLDELSTDFASKLCGNGKDTSGSCTILGVLGQQTFVTRSGKSYGFPGITATVDLVAKQKVATNKLNANDTVSDLIRVIVEALGDSAFNVPGVPNSTLCMYYKECTSETSILQQVDGAGDKAEAATDALVGVATRGGWFASLNNELLADSIMTAAGVTARKITEKAIWSNLDPQHSCVGSKAPEVSFDSFTINFTK